MKVQPWEKFMLWNRSDWIRSITWLYDITDTFNKNHFLNALFAYAIHWGI